ncbi:hypothetical protein IAQ61_009957 [Plenodomus lingam]|uniref:uncharacterized protein n=1 Tax=Leptosphaeria maculans TaxID=5022 RepID=UPI00331905E7|nr:hypothetical protein IAQ61_009957 [Plenodomus lingam]
MMVPSHLTCAILALVFTTTAVLQCGLPQPTVYNPAVDIRSPAPTRAPQLHGLGPVKRQNIQAIESALFSQGYHNPP